MLLHPGQGRLFRIFWNFLRGRETSKMESFLQETKRKFAFKKSSKKRAADKKAVTVEENVAAS